MHVKHLGFLRQTSTIKLALWIFLTIKEETSHQRYAESIGNKAKVQGAQHFETEMTPSNATLNIFSSIGRNFFEVMERRQKVPPFCDVS